MASESDSERARKLGKMVGKWKPAGRRMSVHGTERWEWARSQLRSALEREGLSSHYKVAEEALTDEMLKAVKKSYSDNYRRAYGPDKPRKPSTRKLAGESRDEYAGRLRSMGLSSDEIYKKVYGH